MPPKRYRLKLDHPYAKAGTIVEEDEREVPVNHPTYVTLDESFPEIITIPDTVKAAWLEEVKEEPTCSKEFAEAFVAFFNTRWNCMDSKLFKWIQEHISNEH